MSSDDAIRLVEAAPDRLATMMSGGVGLRSDDLKHWSETGYLWHLVDVIRPGTERLWILTLDPPSGIPGWNEEALAEARRYEALSPIVGLRALDRAIHESVRAAREAPPSAEATHPVFGRLSTRQAIVRNAHEIQHHGRDIERVMTG
ncbi:MAG: hypothetical protein ABI869_04325 [Actinomycetota bacterium]